MNEVQSILAEATIENNTIKLNCGDLERSLYEKIDNVLKRLWGKWNGRQKKHLFQYDPTEALNVYLSSGQLPPKNATAYFPTPKSMVDDMVKIVKNSIFWSEPKILEPSAGQGAFLDVVKEAYPKGEITCVEYLDINASILKKKGYNPIVDDFMEVDFGDNKFDIIIMNPPFSLAGDKKAYITHIMKAHSLLSRDGILMAVAPTGWTWGDRLKDFRDFVTIHSDYVEFYDKGTFKESGTMIETCVMCLRSAEHVKENLDSGYYNGVFDWYVEGHMGQELCRSENKGKTPEQYFDFIVNHSRESKELHYSGGLPLEIDKDECLKIIQSFDNDEYR